MTREEYLLKICEFNDEIARMERIHCPFVKRRVERDKAKFIKEYEGKD